MVRSRRAGRLRSQPPRRVARGANSGRHDGATANLSQSTVTEQRLSRRLRRATVPVGARCFCLPTTRPERGRRCELVAECRGGGCGQRSAADGGCGTGEVERHHREHEPGCVRSQSTRGKVCQGGVPPVGVDLFDDHVAAGRSYPRPPCRATPDHSSCRAAAGLTSGSVIAICRDHGNDVEDLDEQGQDGGVGRDRCADRQHGVAPGGAWSGAPASQPWAAPDTHRACSCPLRVQTGSAVRIDGVGSEALDSCAIRAHALWQKSAGLTGGEATSIWARSGPNHQAIRTSPAYSFQKVLQRGQWAP